ncbi:MAG: response regulator transcription factor [Actinomycetales bacterium]
MGSARILVVDDDRDLRDLVVFKLTQAGHLVSQCATGQDAIAIARAEVPDLVVLDVMMPGLSGIDVLRELRLDPSTRGIRVIMLTARAQEGDTETAFAVGADDYVTKPFSPRELVRRVDAVLSRAVR